MASAADIDHGHRAYFQYLDAEVDTLARDRRGDGIGFVGDLGADLARRVCARSLPELGLRPLSATALGELAVLAGVATDRGVELRLLASAHGPVRRALSITGLARCFTVHVRLADAVAGQPRPLAHSGGRK